MAGITHNMMRLLLFSVIRTGVKGEDALTFAEQGYDITFPCEVDPVCFHVWHISTGKIRQYIAIVTNGEIQAAKSEDEDSKCSLQIKDLPDEDVGHHRCQKRPQITPSAGAELNLAPGKTASLQCVLFTFISQGRCGVQRRQQVSLTWVDETGAEIHEDLRHLVKRGSACDVTLTVTFPSSGNKTFRCQAAVGERVWASVEFGVRLTGLKGRGRGRGFIVEPDVEDVKQDVIGPAVGVVGCAVLTALVAAFVVNRRRTRNQRPDESCTTSSNNVMNTDDVIYADIILPVGSGQVWVHEPTEYACVRYK